ncbi:hypothetical protein L550_3556 [Bordetella pertussis H973]|nr:hypothetical protein L550_3556 [Bordetella pertussis H973]
MYLLGVVVIAVRGHDPGRFALGRDHHRRHVITMIFRANVVVPSLLGTLLVGIAFGGSIVSGVTAVFNASFMAAKELFNIFLVIAFMTALLNALKTLGSDVRMVQPFRAVMTNGHIAFVVLALATYLISSPPRSSRRKASRIGLRLVPKRCSSGPRRPCPWWPPSCCPWPSPPACRRWARPVPSPSPGRAWLCRPTMSSASRPASAPKPPAWPPPWLPNAR